MTLLGRLTATPKLSIKLRSSRNGARLTSRPSCTCYRSAYQPGLTSINTYTYLVYKRSRVGFKVAFFRTEKKKKLPTSVVNKNIQIKLFSRKPEENIQTSLRFGAIGSRWRTSIIFLPRDQTVLWIMQFSVSPNARNKIAPRAIYKSLNANYSISASPYTNFCPTPACIHTIYTRSTTANA